MEDTNLDNPAETETQTIDPDSSPKSIRDLLEEHEEEKKTSDADTDADSTDESTTDETGSDESEEESEEEEIEVKEDEEVEEDEEEPKELTASFGNLNKKYPGIFKEFPSLRAKIGREYAFSEIYPTIDEAKRSAQKAEIFDQYEQEIQLGRPDLIIQALPNMQTAEKFAERVLPALRAINPNLFTKAVDPFVRMMLNKVNSDAESQGDKNLGLAAKYISRYLYGKAEIPSLPSSKSNELDPEKEELKARLSQAEQVQYINFEDSLQSTVSRVLGKEAKTFIDPKDSMSPKMQEILIKQTLEEVDQELMANANHMAKMKAFREKAVKSGLNKEQKTRILSAYLAAARPVLKTVSQRIKTEAFGKKTGENRTEGRKVIPSSSGIGKTPPSKSSTNAIKDVKQFKAKGGRMEDILGGV